MRTTRETLIAKIDQLPDIALEELAIFLEFLLWKAQITKPVAKTRAVALNPLVDLSSGTEDFTK